MEREKILIVDSEADFVEKARKALDSLYEISVAFSRGEGLNKAKEEHSGMVIVGFLEPRGESFNYHKDLREDSATRNIPNLVVDVRPQEHSRKGWRKNEGMQMDAEGYLSRPVETDELRNEVTRILESAATKQMEFKELADKMDVILKRIERIDDFEPFLYH